MKELSLNILDVAQNSISAGATLVQILIDEDENGMMRLRIIDNGCGMSPETVAHVTDPFYTTRTTRKVGLGVPLLKLTAEQTGGSFSIVSVPRETDAAHCGTTVEAVYDTNSIDFTPLGDVKSTICVLLQGHPEIDYIFRHDSPRFHVSLKTTELREILGNDVSLAAFEVIAWIGDYLEEQYQNKSEE